jgi:hypothetical protein
VGIPLFGLTALGTIPFFAFVPDVSKFTGNLPPAQLADDRARRPQHQYELHPRSVRRPGPSGPFIGSLLYAVGAIVVVLATNPRTLTQSPRLPRLLV